MKKIQINILGMHCASCAKLAQKALGNVPGVAEVNVNFATEKATVFLDNEITRVEDLIRVIEKIGYKGSISNGKSIASDQIRKAEEIDLLWKKFIFGAILSIPMLHFMLLDFFPKLPGGNFLPPYFGIISLFLAIPVQFIIGASFYKGMWSSLKMKTFNMDSLIAIGTSTAFSYSLINFILYMIYKNSIAGLNG